MIQWEKTGSFLDQVKAVYNGSREGICFRIVEGTSSSCTVTVDNRNMGCGVFGIENAKQWCEDFEYCYECGNYPVHADKLCDNCYFK